MIDSCFPATGLRLRIAVLARPGASRAEAMIALGKEPKLQLAEMRIALKAKRLGNLYVPRELKYVRNIPKPGTGKVNQREL
jgi:acyl-coenzyme A synthetase/AMP-(fatty) acid ligase